MPARNEVVPLGVSTGPARGALPVVPIAPAPAQPVSPSPSTPHKSKLKHKSTFTNAEALSTQERRTRLVRTQKHHSNCQLFYAFFGLVLMVVQIEYVWFANTKRLVLPCPVRSVDQCPRCRDAFADAVLPITDGQMIVHALRALISVSTLLLLYYIYLFYAAECEVMKLKNIVPPQTTLLRSSLRQRLLLELCMLCIHPFPGVDAVDPRWPHLLVATSLCMCSRIGLVLRACMTRSAFNSSNGWFIGSLTHVDFSASFFLKSALKNHPIRWLALAAVVLVLVAGYALFVVERFLCAFHADACCAPLPLVDALWTLVMTTLTIGYGDVVPQTTPGRLLAVAAAALGSFGMAVTIAVLTNHHVALTRSEHKVHAFLTRDAHRHAVHDCAAQAIQAFVQRVACQRRSSKRRGDHAAAAAARRDSSEYKLYDALQAFRLVQRRVHATNVDDGGDAVDKQLTMLEMMEVNVAYIRTKIEDLSTLLYRQQVVVAAAADGDTRHGGSSQDAHNEQQQQQQFAGPSPAISTASPAAVPSSPASARSVSAAIAAANSSTNNATPPEWARVLHTTLQSIVLHVQRVSSDVERLETHIRNRMDAVDARVQAIEQTLDAGHVERSQHADSRTALRSSATYQFEDEFVLRTMSTHWDGSSTHNGARIASGDQQSTAVDAVTGSHSHHLPLASMPQCASRRSLPCTSSSSSSSDAMGRSPSIRHFLTQRELDEFHTSDDGPPFK